jgi:hypothetical protein
VEYSIDSGAVYSLVPEKTLDSHGIKASDAKKFRPTDGGVEIHIDFTNYRWWYIVQG